MLTTLEAHPEATDPEPFAGPDHPIRVLTRAVAFGKEWTSAHSLRMTAVFDELAPSWSDERNDPSRVTPVFDALDRGEVPKRGSWLEVGSGAGSGARAIVGLVGSLICTDLSGEMLRRAPDIAPRVRADANSLPFPADSFDAVLLLNMLLFPLEIDRVLRPHGTLVWVNSLGEQTPIYLPAPEVLEALPGEWSGLTARAGTGYWLAAQRA